MYNLALIGCGYMGQSHLEELHLNPSVCLKGVCDLNIEAAKKTAMLFNAESYSADSSEYIENPDIDIIIIATYPSSHLKLLTACLENNKHVICEKPVTTTYEEGTEFANLIKAHPECKVLVGHILRHNETYKTVADLIRSGAIGFPIVMRMIQNHSTVNWQKDLKLICDTSPLIDCGVHYVDVMRWFTGAEVKSISAVGTATVPDLPEGKYNHAILTTVMSDNSIGYYEVGWSRSTSNDNTKEFIGPEGRIKIIYQKDRSTHKERGNLIEFYSHKDKSITSINIPFNTKPTGLQLSHLIEMIERGVSANPSINDVMESFRVVCEADKIIKEKTNNKKSC